MGAGWNKDLSELMFSRVPKGARRACWSLFIWGILTGIVLAFMISMSFEPRRADLRSTPGIVFMCILAYVTLGAIVAAFAIERRKSWGRIIAWTVAIPSLASFPGGTFLAVFIIMGLMNPAMKDHFKVARE